MPYIPKLGSRFNHLLMARGIRKTMKAIQSEFAFDVALVSWIYPDACAVSLLAREMGFPFAAIAQGSDVHQYLKIPARRRIIQDSLQSASSVITRSAELARLLREAGIPSTKLTTVYNGVDFSLFHSADKSAARRQLNLPEDGSILLFVGNFLPIKNPMLLVRAHAELCRRRKEKPVYLVMVGSGPLEEGIRQQANQEGFAERVILAGRRPPADVARYMQAADLLCISSHNEGLPNVVLEAFSCGLRIVSTRVGGIHEVLCHDYLGGFVERPDVSGLADTLMAQLGQEPDTNRIAQYASQFSWENAAQAYLELLNHSIEA